MAQAEARRELSSAAEEAATREARGAEEAPAVDVNSAQAAVDALFAEQPADLGGRVERARAEVVRVRGRGAQAELRRQDLLEAHEVGAQTAQRR